MVNRWTFWEGGVNVACFLSGPALPQARRGTVWPGLAHVSDWYCCCVSLSKVPMTLGLRTCIGLRYSTLFVGVAGGSPAEIVGTVTGPRAPDSINLWAALLGGTPSPREEVVHQVNNSCESFSPLRRA